eukprot:g23236.t1
MISEEAPSVQDLFRRVGDLEDLLSMKVGELQSLESRNKQLSLDNADLKQDIADLKEQQALLVSRCDRQMGAMQELSQR